MGFFGDIYCLLESVFGQNLAEFLWGWNCESYSSTNYFTVIGLANIAISVVAFAVHYLLIANPHNLKRNWFIMLAIVIAVNFAVVGLIYHQYNSGLIPDCLMYQFDSQGREIAKLISRVDVTMFGVVNAIYGGILFFAVSFFRYLPMPGKFRNARYSPF